MQYCFFIVPSLWNKVLQVNNTSIFHVAFCLCRCITKAGKKNSTKLYKIQCVGSTF